MEEEIEKFGSLDIPETEAEKEYKESIPDVRRQKFWEMYTNPKSKTFSNAYQSAQRAGYSENYAAIITTKPFFLEKMRRMGLLNKAEKVLDKTLTMDTKDVSGREQADLLRIQVDAAKHITKTLGKDEGYSERNELTGKNGEEIRVTEIVFNTPSSVASSISAKAEELDGN